MGWEHVGNSFIAARDYAEQERAAGREPTRHELGMVGLAARNNPLLGYQRARVRSAAQMDALDVTARQLEVEMMQRKKEGIAKLSALVARSFDDPDVMERNVLKLAYDHNIGMSEIDPILKGIEQKRQYKQRMDQIGDIMKSAEGMRLKSLGMSAQGPTFQFENPASEAAANISADSRTAEDYSKTVMDLERAKSDPTFDPVELAGLEAKKKLLEWKATSGPESGEVRDFQLRQLKLEYVLSRVGKLNPDDPASIARYMGEFDNIVNQLGSGEGGNTGPSLNEMFKQWMEKKSSK